MNRKLSFLVLLAALLLATACTPTPAEMGDKTEEVVKDTTAQEPALPPVPQEVIDQSGVQTFEVDGLKVILKQTPGKPVVSAHLVIPGGLLDDSPQTVGMDSMALRVATQGGTASTPRDAFNQKLNSMGSSIGSSAGRDGAVITMRSVRPFFDQTWELYRQVLTEPAFDEKQLKLTRIGTVESLRSLEDNADGFLPVLANQIYFEGHPYAWQTDGTIENVESFTRQQLMDHYRGLLTRERAFLVVVGDVDKATLEARVSQGLAGLPKGDWEPAALPAFEAGGPTLQIKERPELATNYVLGYFKVPAPDHPDYYPMLVASNYLADRLFEEVRTKRNLTYAVSAGISGRQTNVGYLYTTAVDPNTTVQVMFHEVKKLQEQPLSAKNLEDLINVFLTERYMREETNAAQASSLGNAELNGGGWEESLVFLDRVRAVTPEDVLRVSQTYFKDIHWAYIGKPEAVDQAVFTSQPSEVKPLEEAAAPTPEPVPAR